MYKIVYPNGKIYVGQDRTNNINYFGSADPDLIARDFDDIEREDFSVRRVILWTSDDTNHQEVYRKEMEWILKLRANDPSVGYNRWPRLKSAPQVLANEDQGEEHA